MLLTKKDKALIKQWDELTRQLKDLKEKESKLRDQIFSKLFDDDQEGTRELVFSDKVRLKCSQTYIRTIDSTIFEEICDDLPKQYRESVVRQKYNLNKTVYDALPQKVKDIFDDCLTVKPAKPSLKLITKED
jgi:hypothetical protein